MSSTRTIAEFVRGVDRGQRAAAVAAAVIAQAVVVVVLAIVVEAALPRWADAVLWIGLGSVVLLGCVRWARSRLSVAAIDRRFALGDRLRTWSGGVVAGPFRDWLADDLVQRIGGIAPTARRRPLRRRLRSLRYLLPLLALLLALRWLLPTFGPLPGLPPSGGGGGGSAGAGAGGEPEPGQDDRQTPQQEQQPVPPELEERPDEPPDDTPPEPAAPRDVLDELQVHDDFAVPKFVGDGPSRLTEAHVAETPSAGEVGGSAGATGGGESDTPPELDVEFERAAERALRSRHVREDERAIVRRYFELLVERRR